MIYRKRTKSKHRHVKTLVFLLFLLILQSAMVYYKFEVKPNANKMESMPANTKIVQNRF